MLDQELYKHGDDFLLGALTPNHYWEGAVDITGTGPPGPIDGLGYVEITK